MGYANFTHPEAKWHPGLGDYAGLVSQFNHPSSQFGMGVATSDPDPVSVGGNLFVVDVNYNYLPTTPLYVHRNLDVHGTVLQFRRAIEHLVPKQAVSVGAIKFLAREKPQLARAIEGLKARALRMFPGAAVSTTVYTDPEEGWQKLIFEVLLAQSDRNRAFELEEEFIDAVCDSGEYDSALGKLILRVR